MQNYFVNSIIYLFIQDFKSITMYIKQNYLSFQNLRDSKNEMKFFQYFGEKFCQKIL